MIWKRKKKSPGEALRDRIADRIAAKPAIDREFIEFWVALNSLAEKRYKARAEGDEARPFVHRLYEQFNEDSPVADLQMWLAGKLEDQFLYAYEPPRWIEEEPSWPFLDGQPMVFIYQVPLAENPITREHLTFDSMLYVFGARLPRGKGFEIRYRVVEQLNLQTESQHHSGERPPPLTPPGVTRGSAWPGIRPPAVKG